jgi:hypothetical protein
MSYQLKNQQKNLCFIFAVFWLTFISFSQQKDDSKKGKDKEPSLEQLLQSNKEIADDSQALEKDDKGFYTVQVSQILLSEFISNISNDLQYKIIVDQKIKNLLVTGTYHFNSPESLLKQLSKELSVSYSLEDDVYVLGDKKITIKVLNHSGVSEGITAISPGNIFLIDDKLIVSGTETEVREYSTAIEAIQKKEYINLRMHAFYIDTATFKQFGVEWNKNFTFSGNGENLKIDIDSFLYDFTAAYVDNKNDTHYDSVLDTTMTVISGKRAKLFVGEQIQKEINTVSEGTNGQELVSEFITEEAGLTLDMTFFKSKDDFVIGKLDIEDTRPTGENSETGITYSNHVVITKKPQRVVSLKRTIKSSNYASNMGFFSSVFTWIAKPFKYVFGVEETDNSDLVFVLLLQKVDPEEHFKTVDRVSGEPNGLISLGRYGYILPKVSK